MVLLPKALEVPAPNNPPAGCAGVAAAPNNEGCAGCAAKVEVLPNAGAAGFPKADCPNGVLALAPLNPPNPVEPAVAP